MTVVSLRAFRDPAPKLITIYCALAYWSDRGKLREGKVQHFANAELALRAAQRAAYRAAAVRVTRVRGNPEADYWEAPITLAKFGDRAGEL